MDPVGEGDANHRDTDATLTRRWLPTEEAAQVLGMSVRAVQRRAASQKLPSKREGNRLFVLVECRVNVATNDTLPPESDARSDQARRDTDATEATDSTAVLTQVLREQLAEKDAHIRALLRIVDEDRTEIRNLNARLALTDGAKVDVPVAENAPSGEPAPQRDDLGENAANDTPPSKGREKRGFWAKVLDVLLLRD